MALLLVCLFILRRYYKELRTAPIGRLVDLQQKPAKHFVSFEISLVSDEKKDNSLLGNDYSKWAYCFDTHNSCPL